MHWIVNIVTVGFMRKAEVLKHFKTRAELADLLDIHVQAISMWADVIPEGTAYKLQALTNGALKVDPKKYDKKRAKRAQPPTPSSSGPRP